jgi:hypothetical protein
MSADYEQDDMICIDNSANIRAAKNNGDGTFADLGTVLKTFHLFLRQFDVTNGVRSSPPHPDSPWWMCASPVRFLNPSIFDFYSHELILD